MKKVLLLVAFIGFGVFGFGQNKDAWTENFNSESGSAYTTGTVTINGRDWTAKDAGNFDYGNTAMGSPAFTINDDKPDAYITSPSLNTCGRVSFKYAYKSGSSANVFKLQKSTDGTTYSDLDTHTLGASSNESYVSYYYDVNDNSGTVYIRILSDNQDAHLFIEDYEVTNYNTGVINPSAFTATSSSSSQIDLSWSQNANSNDVLVAWTSDGTFGTPTDGTAYSSGSTIPGGGAVIYNGSSTTFNHTSLNSGTKYYYKAWSVDGSTDYSSGVTDNATTYYTLPISESFEGSSTPNDWTETIVTDPGTDPALTYVQSGTNPSINTADNGSYFVHFNSYTCPDGAEIRLESPPFSSNSSVTVEFAWYEDDGYNYANEGVTVQWSTDGVSWNNGTFYQRYNATTGWVDKTYQLPSGANNQSTLYVGFLFHSQYGNNCNLDDVVISGGSILPEPTNHALGFTATKNGSSQIDLSWDDNDGAQAADGFLIVGKKAAGSYYNPVDGTDPSDDSDWSDNDFNVKVSHGNESYSVTGLSSSTTYDFKIYPYTNSVTNIDYKTDGTIPTASATTDAALDADTEVYDSAPGMPQPPATDISSLKDTDAEAVDVFRMVIQDQGTSDGLVTKVTNIRIKPHTTNTADWTDNIQGVKLDDGSVYITLNNVNITDSYIDIAIASGDLNIADGGTKTITMSIYLNATGLKDNAVLSFMVDASSHGFTADASGSDFISTFALGDFNSNDFTIDVSATELQFIQNTSNVAISTNMTPAPTVAYTDENGNIELDLDGAGIEMTATGVTLVGSPVTATIAVGTGLATFSTLQFSPAASGATLTADETLNLVTPSIITSSIFDVLNVGSDVFISEVVDPADIATARYVELFNPTASAIDFSAGNYYLKIQANGAGSPSNVSITGTIQSNSTYICAFNDSGNPSNFENAYGYIWDEESSNWSGNGDDNYYLYKGATLIDMYGVHDEDGTGKDWEYTNSHAVRKRDIINPNTTWTASEWVITHANADQMTPGKHAQNITWQGATTDWNTKGSSNWTGSDFVPDASDNVTIASAATFDPIISEPAACNNLTIEAGAVTTLNAGQSFTVVGTLSNTGQSSLVLNSDGTSGPSSLIHNTNSVPATVNSYFTEIPKWYLVSPPISDAKASVFLGQYLDSWDEPSGLWVDIIDENVLLAPAQGYSLKKTTVNTATYSGSLNNGNITISGLRRTGGTYEGWNLVGNPYPSVLSVDDMSFTNIDAGVSVWPHTGSNSSAYIPYSKGTGGNSEARYIQPGQGFMVQVTSGQDNQSLTLTNDMRTHTGLGQIDKKATDSSNDQELLKIVIYGDETTRDETYLGFRDGATFDFDSYYDVHKLYGAVENPYIFSYIDLEEPEHVAIQSFPQPKDGDLVHLGTRITIEGNYKLDFKGVSTFADNQAFILLDKKTNETYKIRSNPTISFYHENNDSENRFDLLFKMTTGIDEIDGNTDDFIAYVNNSKLYISLFNDMEDDTQIEIFDILGQRVLNKRLSEALNGIPINLSSAYYVVEIKSNTQVISKKIYLN